MHRNHGHFGLRNFVHVGSLDGTSSMCASTVCPSQRRRTAGSPHDSIVAPFAARCCVVRGVGFASEVGILSAQLCCQGASDRQLGPPRCSTNPGQACASSRGFLHCHHCSLEEVRQAPIDPFFAGGFARDSHALCASPCHCICIAPRCLSVLFLSCLANSSDHVAQAVSVGLVCRVCHACCP